MLDALGVTDAQADAYRRLIEHGPTTPDATAHAPGERADPPGALDGHLLDELLRAGLAVRDADGRITAAPPTTALAGLLLDHEASLQRARAEVDRLAEQYRRSAAGRLPAEIVELAHGRAQVAERFARLQAEATQEILATVRADVAAIDADATGDEEDALARGVGYRVLVDRACLERPGFYAAIERVARQGTVVRVARTVPLRMLIADRRTAMVPMGAATTGAEGALLIHPSGLLDAMVLLFEELWEKGSELSPAHAMHPSDEHPDALDRQLLTLLLAGVTDRAIAAHLGLSLRTVQRRLRSLMDVCGVDTRLQLGFEAGRRGWLPRATTGHPIE